MRDPKFPLCRIHGGGEAQPLAITDLTDLRGIDGYNSNLKVDLDFWYRPTIENYENLVQALDEMQIDTSDLKKLVFDKDQTFLKISHKDFHTDFLPIMEGLDYFLDCRSKAESVTIDGYYSVHYFV